MGHLEVGRVTHDRHGEGCAKGVVGVGLWFILGLNPNRADNFSNSQRGHLEVGRVTHDRHGEGCAKGVVHIRVKPE